MFVQSKTPIEEQQEAERLAAHWELIGALQLVRDRYERYLAHITMLNFLPRPEDAPLSFPEWLKSVTKDIERWQEIFA